LIPITEITQTIEQTKHRFEEVDVALVIKAIKPSMKKGYWFVRLNEDAAPSLVKVKTQLLVFMQKLR
jgi:hypothetical protein